jgi:hypothetical protein
VVFSVELLLSKSKLPTLPTPLKKELTLPVIAFLTAFGSGVFYAG